MRVTTSEFLETRAFSALSEADQAQLRRFIGDRAEINLDAPADQFIPMRSVVMRSQRYPETPWPIPATTATAICRGGRRYVDGIYLRDFAPPCAQASAVVAAVTGDREHFTPVLASVRSELENVSEVVRRFLTSDSPTMVATSMTLEQFSRLPPRFADRAVQVVLGAAPGAQASFIDRVLLPMLAAGAHASESAVIADSIVSMNPAALRRVMGQLPSDVAARASAVIRASEA